MQSSQSPEHLNTAPSTECPSMATLRALRQESSAVYADWQQTKSAEAVTRLLEINDQILQIVDRGM